jgi:hypothetical protein
MESINEIQIASIETIFASLSYVALILEIEGVFKIRHMWLYSIIFISQMMITGVYVMSVCPCFTGVSYEYLIVMAMFACCQAFKTAFESTTAIVIETSSFLCLHTSIHNFLRCGIGCNLKLKFFSVHEYACICNLLNFISFPFFFTITYILG